MCYFDIGKDLFPWAGSWTRYEIIISNFFKPYLPWVKYFVKYGKVSHETDDIKAITHENHLNGFNQRGVGNMRPSIKT